jgi:hypothetical protein
MREQADLEWLLNWGRDTVSPVRLAGWTGTSRRPGGGMRALLWLTTSRFCPAKRLLSLHRPVFVECLDHGWMLRETCPRYFLCWRNSALNLESPCTVAIFPRAASDLEPLKRSVYLTFELLRRIARIRLLDDGKPPWAVDSADATATLMTAVAQQVLGAPEEQEHCARLLCDAELTILEAAVGWPIRRTPAATAFLPRYLTHQ